MRRLHGLHGLGGLIASVGVILGSLMTAETAAGQEGRIIDARDGDTVIVRENMRVRVVKRTSGIVRIAVNQPRGFIVVMLDKGGDGRADWVYRFNLDQPYPLEAPWEGAADVDEYHEPGRPSGSIAVVTPQGVIQFISGAPGPPGPHAVPNALAIIRSQSTTGGVVSDAFDVVEPYWLEGRENEYRPGGGQRPNVRSSLSMKAVTRLPDGSLPPEAFVAPRRIHRVDPTVPEVARAANVSGVVIVDITVAADGTVTKARIRRSIPLLDEAALTAVRQWRYEPARRHGQPVEHETTEGVYVGPPTTPPNQPKP
jgi:periplasmic protein TonB